MSWALEGALQSRASGRAAASSLLECRNDAHFKRVEEPAPACLDEDAGCSTEEDFTQLQRYSQAVDASLEEPLRRVREARRTFERRANDLRYAELMGKADEVVRTYGPSGPLAPGGSYLYELKRWHDSLLALHRACQRGGGACSSILGHLQEHPEEDVVPDGSHGRAGSGIYDEISRACQLGRSRAPVPNDEPVWCDDLTGTCERKSSREWWAAAHPKGKKGKPWVDDREAYDDLKEACSWIANPQPSDSEINELQSRLAREVDHLHEEYCSPKWVEGYCSAGSGAQGKRHEKCILESGQHCRHGLVVPGTEMDDTFRWKEPFPEHPVHVTAMPPLLSLLPVWARRDACRTYVAIQRRRRREEPQQASVQLHRPLARPKVDTGMSASESAADACALTAPRNSRQVAVAPPTAAAWRSFL